MTTYYTYYVTIWALTKGILEVDAHVYTDQENAGTIRFEIKGFGYYAHGEGREWHKTLESAILKAEEMRVRTIQKHELAIERLKKLEIKVKKLEP